MRKSVTRLIRHCSNYQDNLVTSDGNSRDSAYLTMQRVRVPQSAYYVTFRLDPKGPYVASHKWVGTPNRMRGYYVCFMPPEWSGMRISRKVTLAKGRR